MMPVKSDIGRENSPDQGDHPEELPFSQPPREAGSLGLVAIFSAAPARRPRNANSCKLQRRKTAAILRV